MNNATTEKSTRSHRIIGNTVRLLDRHADTGRPPIADEVFDLFMGGTFPNQPPGQDRIGKVPKIECHIRVASRDHCGGQHMPVSRIIGHHRDQLLVPLGCREWKCRAHLAHSSFGRLFRHTQTDLAAFHLTKDVSRPTNSKDLALQRCTEEDPREQLAPARKSRELR